MPKMKVDEDEDIVSFSAEETDALDKYFKGTNTETAYLLGRYCGLRINECYGLKWTDVDFDNNLINIEYQMQYHEGLIKLLPLKTRNARRSVYMNSKLKTHLLKNNLLNINIETGNTAVDDFFKGNVQLINNFMMALAEQQIKAAFEQSEKEVLDLHSRISQGLREAKKNGSQIGLPKGTTLETKKSILCKSLIKKHSKDFGSSLEDSDVIKLCGCSRNSYYKYKREIKAG